MKKTNKLIDFFFPKYCLNCHALNSWLCPTCFKKINLSQATCFICGKIKTRGEICPLCLYHQGEKEKIWLIKSLIWVGDYKNKILKNLIMALKYGGVKEIADILGSLLNQSLENTWPKQKAILVPIPISKPRKRQRGYNQAELIAQAIVNNNTNLTIKDNLKISRVGKKQTGRKIKNRWSNLNQFTWTGQTLINKSIIIIDDVVTTGATLNSAALALKKAKAKNIKAATILRA